MLARIESPVGFGSANLLTNKHHGKVFHGNSKAEVIIRKAPVPTHLAQCCLVFNSSLTHKPSKLSFPVAQKQYFQRPLHHIYHALKLPESGVLPDVYVPLGAPGHSTMPATVVLVPQFLPMFLPCSCHKYLKASATWQWENNAINNLCVASSHA